MTAGVLLSIALALVGLAYVIAPLLRRDSLETETLPESSLDRVRELHARRQMLLSSLKDLEDDRQTDKIAERDYEQLKTRLSAQAIDVMRHLDAAEEERERELGRQRAASRPLAYPGKRQPDRNR